MSFSFKKKKLNAPPSWFKNLFGVSGGIIGLGAIGILHFGVGTLGALFSLSSLASFFLSGSFGSLLGIDAFLDSLSLSLDFLKVTLDDGAGHGANLINLGNVDALGGVLALVVEPVLRIRLVLSFKYWWSLELAYLGSLKLGTNLVLLLIAGEIGILLLQLGTKIVNVSLKLVLLLVSVGDELVFHDHGSLLLGQGGAGSFIERRGAAGDGQVTGADLLLDLASLLGGVVLLVSVHGLKQY